jgi:nitroreductase
MNYQTRNGRVLALQEKLSGSQAASPLPVRSSVSIGVYRWFHDFAVKLGICGGNGMILGFNFVLAVRGGPPAGRSACCNLWIIPQLARLRQEQQGKRGRAGSGIPDEGSEMEAKQSSKLPQDESFEAHRLAMPVGEAMFTQRAIRRMKPDPIPVKDLKLILDAASKAPNGGNRQVARFLLITDRAMIQEFGKLYREAWWAKRADEKHSWTRREDIPADEKNHRSAARLADEIKDAPCLVIATAPSAPLAHSVLPACQNLMLAARTLGVGSVLTTLHPKVLDRVHALLKIPKEVAILHVIPLGYPQGHFGPNTRLPTSQTTYFNSWGAPVPWK